MYVEISACVRVKGSESRMRQGCIVSPWLFNIYMDGVMREVNMEMRRRGVSFLEDGREWRLPASCM